MVHMDRPEWGVGVVLSSQAIGDGTQRMRIRFERAGMKTLAVPPAMLQSGATDAGTSAGQSDPLHGLSEEAVAQVMASLPEATNDPFTTLESRIRATLELYRFEPIGGSLIDWASIQSRMADPLSRFARQELEALFRRFELERDAHLRRLLDEARRTSPGLLGKLSEAAPSAQRRTLSRFTGR